MRLVAGFDIGTAYSSVSFILTSLSPDNAANRISTEDLEVVMFNGRKQISSELAWCDLLSCWVWGSDVDELVGRGNIQENHIFKMLKLCLALQKSNLWSQTHRSHVTFLACTSSSCGKRPKPR